MTAGAFPKVKRAQRQFIAVVDVECRIPKEHPIREIKKLAEEVFNRMSGRFNSKCSEIGRFLVDACYDLSAKRGWHPLSVNEDDRGDEWKE